jgi:hypothetical protein
MLLQQYCTCQPGSWWCHNGALGQSQVTRILFNLDYSCMGLPRPSSPHRKKNIFQQVQMPMENFVTVTYSQDLYLCNLPNPRCTCRFSGLQVWTFLTGRLRQFLGLDHMDYMYLPLLAKIHEHLNFVPLPTGLTKIHEHLNFVSLQWGDRRPHNRWTMFINQSCSKIWIGS